MIIPQSQAELKDYAKAGKHIFFFTADWCSDCVYIKPVMPEIEAAFPDYRFVEVDRDQYLELATAWQILGIPSFVATDNGTETGRLVSKDRKTKAEIMHFLNQL